MTNKQTPPPPPYTKKMTYGEKIVRLGLQCGVLMIGAITIWIMSYSRDETSIRVSNRIVDEWGKTVYISGPFIGEGSDRTNYISPDNFTCEATVDTKSLHRNIYEAIVFTANVNMSATFAKDSLAALCDTACIKLDVGSDQIMKLSPLKIGGQQIEWTKRGSELIASIDISDMPQVIEFSTGFDVNGSGSLYISPVGKEYSITIDGEATNPSFNGSIMPVNRTIDGRKFSANWNNYNSPDNYHDCYHESVGADFLIGVNSYQKVSRSLKYAFIIILLTYISVLFSEIIVKHNIPLLNYFLIGAALILFYSLLLAFCDIFSFGISYLISSVMTIGLITGYMWKMLDSAKISIVIGSILTGLYVTCYVMLSLTTYALLFGSLILFIALAAMMYGSLKTKYL